MMAFGILEKIVEKVFMWKKTLDDFYSFFFKSKKNASLSRGKSKIY